MRNQPPDIPKTLEYIREEIRKYRSAGFWQCHELAERAEQALTCALAELEVKRPAHAALKDYRDRLKRRTEQYVIAKQLCIRAHADLQALLQDPSTSKSGAKDTCRMLDEFLHVTKED